MLHPCMLHPKVRPSPVHHGGHTQPIDSCAARIQSVCTVFLQPFHADRSDRCCSQSPSIPHAIFALSPGQAFVSGGRQHNMLLSDESFVYIRLQCSCCNKQPQAGKHAHEKKDMLPFVTSKACGLELVNCGMRVSCTLPSENDSFCSPSEPSVGLIKKSAPFNAPGTLQAGPTELQTAGASSGGAGRQTGGGTDESWRPKPTRAAPGETRRPARQHLARTSHRPTAGRDGQRTNGSAELDSPSQTQHAVKPNRGL